jgi:hypothetical protein
MRISRAVPLLFAALAFAACGGSGSKTADAHPINTPDANTSGNPDAATGTPDAASSSGLTCSVSGQTVTGCDALTSQSNVTCLYDSTMNGFCSTACSSGATVTANAQGTDLTAGDYTAAGTAGDAACQSFYGSNAPTAQIHCALPINFNPAIGSGNPPLTPDGTYTVDWYCAVTCDTGQSCPSGMVCNQGLCDHM